MLCDTLNLLKALAAARAAMPVLEKTEHGEGRHHGEDFSYPDKDDLQTAATTAFTGAGLELVPVSAVVEGHGQAARVTCCWQLVHLPSGEFRDLKLVWSAPADLAAHHSCAATWTHAWRHAVGHLLNVRALSREKFKRLTASPEEQRRQLDMNLGPMPDWPAPLAVIDRADVIPPTSASPTSLLDSPSPTEPVAPSATDSKVAYQLFLRWRLRELDIRRAVDPKSTPPTIDDAWSAASGGPPRPPVTTKEQELLLKFLQEDEARHQAA